MEKVTVSVFPVGPKKILHYRFQVDRKRTQRSTGLTHKQRRQAREVAEKALEVAKLRAQGIEPEPTVAGLVEGWIKAHALRVSPAHVTAVERFGKLHLGELAGLLPSQCSTTRVERALNAYLEAGHAPASGNQWLAYLRLLMGWAMRSDMIRQVPYRVRPLRVQRKPKVILPTSKAPKWFKHIERAYILEPGVMLAIYLMAALGLRESEALGARWQWLDLDRGLYSPGQTKGREARERPVPPWLLDRLIPLAQPMGLIAMAANGGKISHDKVRRAIFSANEACGITGLTAHRLRATYATMLSEAGVPIQDIQWIVGHKDIRTTMIYLGVDLARVRAGQDRIAERWAMVRRGCGERSPKTKAGTRCDK